MKRKNKLISFQEQQRKEQINYVIGAVVLMGLLIGTAIMFIVAFNQT